MIKCVHNMEWTCIGRSGKPKKSYDTDKFAISHAKKINNKEKSIYTKLVAYKCSNCQKYHLTTVYKKVK